MKLRTACIVSATALSLGACLAPTGTWTHGDFETSGGRNPRTSADYDHPLYARDGGVVDAQGPGTVERNRSPAHDVEQKGTGRMYILELYQGAIDERDVLSLEVTALTTSLERARAEIEGLGRELAESRAALQVLGEERERWTADRAELTARLVTAQIRRLESEKLLLESKLEWYTTGKAAVEAKSPSVEETP